MDDSKKAIDAAGALLVMTVAVPFIVALVFVAAVFYASMRSGETVILPESECVAVCDRVWTVSRGDRPGEVSWEQDGGMRMACACPGGAR